MAIAITPYRIPESVVSAILARPSVLSPPSNLPRPQIGGVLSTRDANKPLLRIGPNLYLLRARSQFSERRTRQIRYDQPSALVSGTVYTFLARRPSAVYYNLRQIWLLTDGTISISRRSYECTIFGAFALSGANLVCV